MDIIPLDHDDDVMMRGLYRLAMRSQSVSRVQPVARTEEEFFKAVRFAFPGEREVGAVAVIDGSPVGWARVFFPERDNLDKCWSDLEVDPEHRGAGVGSALVDWMEQRGREGGRQLLLGDVFVPVGDRESHADRRFALERGYSVASIEIVRSLPLPVPPDVLAEHRARAAESVGEAYELSVHVDGVPPELRQGVCDASNRLILDAPTGDVEFEPESQTVEDYETTLAHLRDAGSTLLTAVAVHRASGVAAAYTDLCVPSGDPHIVFQWGTLVLPEHRGHRLGVAVKVANLEELARRAQGRRSVQTTNDEQNPWMVSINKDLGFEIIEEALTMKKAL